MTFDDYNYKMLNEIIFEVVISTIQSDDQSPDSINSSRDHGDENDRRSHQDQDDRIRDEEKTQRKIFSQEQITDIKQLQAKDVFMDLQSARDEALIDKDKKKNLVDLDGILNTMANELRKQVRRKRTP